MDGLILVQKSAPATSHDVVAALRRILGQKKVGHFGTLDPLATGLLLAAAGKATRLFPFYGKMDKRYEGRIRLGFATDTYDAAGLPASPECNVYPNRAAVEQACRGFVGDLIQIPPPFSAKKVDGKPLYAYARSQKPVAGRPFRARVDAFDVRGYEPPIIDIAVTCGSGTYIRSLAHDLGQKLGCGAHLAALVRTGVGEFRLEEALTLEEIRDCLKNGRTEGFLRPMESLLPSLPRVDLDSDDAEKIRHGRPISAAHHGEPGEAGRPLSREPGAVVRLFGPDGRLIGLARRAAESPLYAPFLVL